MDTKPTHTAFLAASASLLLLAVCTLPVLKAGDSGYPAAAGKQVTFPEVPQVNPFQDSRRPISNPTLFDLAIPQTQLHPFVAYHRLPSTMNTVIGDVPVDGHVEVYAVQLEIALNERWSINAAKDGYVRFRPDSTLSDAEGWANITAGLKYAWLLKPEEKLASSFQLLYEIPSGSRDVFQGEGDGILIPSVGVLKLWDRWQFADQLGFRLPIDSDADSTSFYNSFHTSYMLTDWLFPTFEVNWFAVLDEGDGGRRFNNQVGGAVPGLVTFEGNDLFNFGASNARQNKHLVTFALGLRARVPETETVDLGFGWEFPVTSDNRSVFDDRFYFDVVWRF